MLDDRLSQMNKVADKVIKFIEGTMKNLKLELIIGGKRLAEVKIQRGTFQGYALLPSLFVTAMKPFNHILKKCSGGYKLHKSQEKINLLVYMDDIKLFAKNEKDQETLIQAMRIYSQNIGMNLA